MNQMRKLVPMVVGLATVQVDDVFSDSFYRSSQEYRSKRSGVGRRSRFTIRIVAATDARDACRRSATWWVLGVAPRTEVRGYRMSWLRHYSVKVENSSERTGALVDARLSGRKLRSSGIGPNEEPL